MFRKLTVIAVAALACSGAMAATETFNFNSQGGTLDAISFGGTLVNTGSVSLDSNPLTALVSTGGINVYSFNLTGAAGALTSHTVSYSGIMAGESVSFTSIPHQASPIVSTSVAAVPEPETYAMMLAGLGALGFVGRRRKAK